MKDSCTVAGTGDADDDQIFVHHVVDKVDVVPSVGDELVVVLAETEIAEPLFN